MVFNRSAGRLVFGYAQNGSSPSIATPEFQQVWERTDRPVLDGDVVRTWIWGPGPNTGLITEIYTDADDDERLVQYFDKSRMEMPWGDADPDSPWFVTQGLLATELMTGQVQLGDMTFQAHPPSQIPVAGDPVNNVGPTYAEMGGLMDAPARETGALITEWIDPVSGEIVDLPELAEFGVTDAHFDDVMNHNVASVFWDFMNSSGLIYVNGSLTNGPIFENPLYGVGRPRTEAYWGQVTVAEVEQHVLIQCFERRCLTFAPGDPEGWEVESGNIGHHYYTYRYHEIDLQDPDDPEDTGAARFEVSPTAVANQVGDTHELTVTVFDDSDDLLDGVSVSAEVVSTSGETGAHLGVTMSGTSGDAGPGTAVLSYTGTEAGTDQIVVSVAGVAGTRTVSKTWVAAPVEPGDPAELTLEPESAGPLMVGEWHTVTARLSDADGLPVSDGTEIDIEVRGANSRSVTRATTNGSVTYSYISEDVGEDEIVATHGSLISGIATVEWVHRPIDRVELTIDPQEQSIDSMVSLSVSVFDEFNNAIPDLDIIFSSNVHGNLGTFTTGSDGEPAVIAAHGATVPGVESISVTETSTALGDSGQISWTIGVAAVILLSQDDSENPWGTEHTVSGTFEDQHGNTLENFNGNVEYLINGELAGTEAASDGLVAFTYTGPDEDRTDTITARLADNHDVQQQEALTKTWVAGDPASLELTHQDGTDGQASNPITHTHTVIATVLNAGNVPMPGANIDFAVSGEAHPGAIGETDPDASSPDNRGVTGGDGIVTFTYTGVNPGVDTIEANVPETSLAASVQKEWTSLQISLSHVPEERSQRHVGEAQTILATVVDAGDSPLGNVLVRFDIDSESPNSEIIGQAGGTGEPGNGAHYGWTDENGQVDFVYTGENTGTDTVHATVLVSPSIETTVTDQIDVDWYQWSISLEHAEGHQPVNPVGADHAVVATVSVEGPGPVDQVPVQFTVTGDGAPAPSEQLVPTEPDGTATFQFTNPDIGTNTIEAAIVDRDVEPATIQKHWAIPTPTFIELELIDPNPDFVFDAFDPDRQYLTFRATVRDQFQQAIQADHVRFSSESNPSQSSDGFGFEPGFDRDSAEQTLTVGTGSNGEVEIVFRRSQYDSSFPNLPSWGDVEISASLLDGPDGATIDSDEIDVRWEQRNFVIHDFSGYDGAERGGTTSTSLLTLMFLPVPDGDLRVEHEVLFPIDCDPSLNPNDYLGVLLGHVASSAGSGSHEVFDCIDGVFQSIFEISLAGWGGDESVLLMESSGDIPLFIPVGVTEVNSRIIDDETDTILASHTETFEILDSEPGVNEPSLGLDLSGFDGVGPGATNLEEIAINLNVPGPENDGRLYPGGVQLIWEITLPEDCVDGETLDGADALALILETPSLPDDGFESFDRVCGEDGVYRVISTPLPLVETFDFIVSVTGLALPETFPLGEYTVHGELYDIDRDEVIATASDSFEILEVFNWSITIEDKENQPQYTHVGNEHTLIATVSIDDGPIEGVEVTFAVVDGPNEDAVGFINDSEEADNTGLTNELGQIEFTYTGEEPDNDTIRATVTDSRAVDPAAWDEIDRGWYEVELLIDPSEDTTRFYYDDEQLFWAYVLLIHGVVVDAVPLEEIVQILDEADGNHFIAVQDEALAPFSQDILDAVESAGYNFNSFDASASFAGMSGGEISIVLTFEDGKGNVDVFIGTGSGPFDAEDGRVEAISHHRSSTDLQVPGVFTWTARVETTDEVYEVSSTKTFIPLDSSTNDTLAFAPEDLEKVAFTGHETTLSATLIGENPDPIEGALVAFDVSSQGSNEDDLTFYGFTDVQGEAVFSYQRDDLTHDDVTAIAYYFKDGELVVTPVETDAVVEWQP